MRTSHFSRSVFIHNLERNLTSRGLKPWTINLQLLASDLLAAVDDAEHKTPGAILDELGGRVRATLPAYNKAKPFGPRLPAADNINPHTPAVDDADFLVADREPFNFDEWLAALASLTQWATSHTEAEVHTLRLEDALVDLLIESPDVSISDRTARMLAGQVGMERLAEILTASSRQRYYGESESPADEDTLSLDLTAGPGAWKF